MGWILYDDGAALWQEMYDTNGYNVVATPCGVIAPETSGWFKNEINGVEEITQDAHASTQNYMPGQNNVFTCNTQYTTCVLHFDGSIRLSIRPSIRLSIPEHS